MKAYNKKKKLNKNNTYNIIIQLENCETYVIPQKYIQEIQIKKHKIKKLVISKSYFDVIKENCHIIHADTLYHINRFSTTTDITEIIINKKLYMPNYIEDYCWQLNTNNILQTTIETNSKIIFKWDINEINKVKYTDYYAYATVLSKYKHLLHNYHKIISK